MTRVQQSPTALTTAEISRQRDELFEQASYGIISGAEADAEAIKRGLGSLSTTPPPEQFDPLRESHWSLPMAVAWIAYRSVEAVREWWPSYRNEYTYWKQSIFASGPGGEIHEGWILETLSKGSLALLGLADIVDRSRETDGKSTMSITAAKEALWTALRTDCFRATATFDGYGYRHEIEPIKWIDLVCIERRGEDQLVPENRLLSEDGAFTDVLLPSAPIRGLWRVPQIKRQLTLPPLVRPDGDGFMPLYCAAQWIATKGGELQFAPEDKEHWRPAFRELLSAIASLKVGVIGTQNGTKGPVPRYHFADCRVAYPYEDLDLDVILGEDTYLQTYAYDDEEDWRRGLSDSLVNRKAIVWSRLMVAKEDVRENWPFDATRPPERTGMAGRPTSKHLVVEEMQRRYGTGEMSLSISTESRYLSEWLAARPSLPQAKPKSIETSIRELHRRLLRQK